MYLNPSGQCDCDGGGFLSTITGGEWNLLLLFLILSAGLSVLMLLIMVVLQLVTGGGLETEFLSVTKGALIRRAIQPGHLIVHQPWVQLCPALCQELVQG